MISAGDLNVRPMAPGTCAPVCAGAGPLRNDGPKDADDRSETLASWRALQNGGAPYVMGMADGTMNQMKGPICFLSVWLAYMAVGVQFVLWSELLSVVRYGDKRHIAKASNILGMFEKEFFYLSIVLEMLRPVSDPLYGPVIRSGPRIGSATYAIHKYVWTPWGATEAVKNAWDNCGRPGSGLGEWVKKFFSVPQRAEDLSFEPVPTVRFDAAPANLSDLFPWLGATAASLGAAIYVAAMPLRKAAAAAGCGALAGPPAAAVCAVAMP